MHVYISTFLRIIQTMAHTADDGNFSNLVIKGFDVQVALIIHC